MTERACGYELCEPKELSLPGEERNFVLRELKNKSAALIAVDDGGLKLILTGALDTLGVLTVLTPKLSALPFSELDFSPLRHEFSASERAYKSGLDCGADESFAEGFLGRVLNLDSYLRGGTQRVRLATKAIVGASKFFWCAAELCGAELEIIPGGEYAGEIERFDCTAFALLALSALTSARELKKRVRARFFTDAEYGIGLTLSPAPKKESLFMVRSIFELINLPIEFDGSTLRAGFSRPEVSLLGLKQDPFSDLKGKL